MAHDFYFNKSFSLKLFLFEINLFKNYFDFALVEIKIILF